MTTTYKIGQNEPFVIGALLDQGQYEFMPFSLQEQERAHGFMTTMLSTFHFRSGSHLLCISRQDLVTHFLPLERSAMDYGLIVCSAEDSPYDVRRVESIMRRFDVSAVCAVSTGVVDGLLGEGFDLAEVFGDAVVWAYPDAASRLPGDNTYLFEMIGPATAVECKHRAGLHLDPREWRVETVDGEIHLTSKQPRSMDFTFYPTGMKGDVVDGVCACGTAGPRVSLK